MTFARQVWWSRVGGIGLAVLSLALTRFVALMGERWAVSADLAQPALFLAAVLGIVGGVIRPIQRWYCLRVLQPSTLYSSRYKRWARGGRLGEWWLHVDAAGLDREDGHG